VTIWIMIAIVVLSLNPSWQTCGLG